MDPIFRPSVRHTLGVLSKVPPKINCEILVSQTSILTRGYSKGRGNPSTNDFADVKLLLAGLGCHVYQVGGFYAVLAAVSTNGQHRRQTTLRSTVSEGCEHARLMAGLIGIYRSASKGIPGRVRRVNFVPVGGIRSARR